MADGFTFFVSYYEGLKQVPEEYRLEAYEAIMDYVFEGIEPSDDASPWVQIVFRMAKPTIDNGLTSKENGKKGGAPKGNKNAEKAKETKETTETTEIEEKNNLKTTETTPLVFENNPPFDFETTNKNKNMNMNRNMNKKSNEEELKDYCTELPAQSAAISMPLNDGSEFPIFDADVREWEKLYPAVDVMQELRNARGWLLGNPTRRKTKAGIKRFITGWLAKEQNKGRSAPMRAAPRAVQDSFPTKKRDLSYIVE